MKCDDRLFNIIKHKAQELETVNGNLEEDKRHLEQAANSLRDNIAQVKRCAFCHCDVIKWKRLQRIGDCNTTQEDTRTREDESNRAQ